MSIKMIVTDMDGTLLNHHHVISENTIDILVKAQQLGIKVVLASGRSSDNLKSFVSSLQLDTYKGCLIGMNGQMIYDYQDTAFDQFQMISPQEANDLLKIAKRYALGGVCMSYNEVYSYLPKWLSLVTRLYCKFTHTKVFFGFEDEYEGQHLIHDPNYVFTKPINKVCFAQLGIWLSKWTPLIKHKLKDKYEVFVLKKRWIEILPKGISKGNALKKIMAKYDIHEDEVLAFGDGENDLSMLLAVTYGYSVDNALAQVKTNTKYHCESNDDDGVAKTILKHLQEEGRL